MTRIIPKPAPWPRREEEPFYCLRYIDRVRPDGTVEVETVLLTLEDVLHPQEGDVIPENSVHEAERRYLSDTCHAREARLERGLILSDCLVDWGIDGLGNHSPDISVFSDLKARQPEPIGIFDFRASGGRCLTLIELVSPHTRSTDVEGKTREYHRVKVPLFVMVDQEQKNGPRTLRVFRYAPAEYIEERPERVLLEPLGIWLGLKDNRVICYDAGTGEEVGDYTQVQQAREAAELLAREQSQARTAAEQLAREQGQARAAAEQRIRELEAELRQARGSDRP